MPTTFHIDGSNVLNHAAFVVDKKGATTEFAAAVFADARKEDQKFTGSMKVVSDVAKKYLGRIAGPVACSVAVPAARTLMQSRLGEINELASGLTTPASSSASQTSARSGGNFGDLLKQEKSIIQSLAQPPATNESGAGSSLAIAGLKVKTLVSNMEELNNNRSMSAIRSANHDHHIQIADLMLEHGDAILKNIRNEKKYEKILGVVSYVPDAVLKIAIDNIVQNVMSPRNQKLTEKLGEQILQSAKAQQAQHNDSDRTYHQTAKMTDNSLQALRSALLKHITNCVKDRQDTPDGQTAKDGVRQALTDYKELVALETTAESARQAELV